MSRDFVLRPARLGALSTARLAYVLAAALALFGIVFIASAAIG